MFSRSLLRFKTSARLGHRAASVTSTFHLASRHSIIENTRYLSFSAVKSQKGQSLFNKTSMFGDREMSVDLTQSQEHGHEFYGTSSYIFLSPEQANALLAALKDVPEEIKEPNFAKAVSGLSLTKFSNARMLNSLRIGHSYTQRNTLVNVDAIPAFMDILQSAVDEYNKITSQTRDELMQA